MSYETTNKSDWNSDQISGSDEPHTITVKCDSSSCSGCFPVSASFRLWFLSYFRLVEPDGSITQPNLELFRLASYLLSTPGYRDPHGLCDDDEINILVGRKQLRSVMRPGCHDDQFRAAEALSRFRKKMWPITTEPYDYHLGQVRRVSKQNQPQQLQIRLREELSGNSGGLVDLVTGEPYVPTCPAAAESTIPELERLRSELNGLEDATFAGLASNIPDAKAFILRQNWKVDRMQRQLTMLRHIEVVPKPTYKAVAGTTRLYATGSNWLGLIRPVRDELTSEFWKLDLKGAQLHISSGLWGWDIDPFIVEGSVWTYLLRRIGYSRNKTTMKDELKRFIYATLFGAEKHTLRTMAEHMGHPELMKDPLIVAILKARSEVAKKLEDGGYLLDAWGHQHKLTETMPRQRSRQIRSIMAAVCQSYELKLLLPLIELAKEKGFKTVAILHDCIYGAGDWGSIINELCAELESQSEAILGKKIQLEATPPKEKSSLGLAA